MLTQMDLDLMAITARARVAEMYKEFYKRFLEVEEDYGSIETEGIEGLADAAETLQPAGPAF